MTYQLNSHQRINQSILESVKLSLLISHDIELTRIFHVISRHAPLLVEVLSSLVSLFRGGMPWSPSLRVLRLFLLRYSAEFCFSFFSAVFLLLLLGTYFFSERPPFSSADCPPLEVVAVEHI